MRSSIATSAGRVWTWPTLLLLIACTLGACRKPIGEPPSEARGFTWDASVVEKFGALPVQHRGRIKPLSTLAAMQLMAVNGSRTLRLGGEKLNPTEWLLDCLFFPELARSYRCITVDFDQALTAIGVKVEGRKRRDRYSFDELLPGRAELSRRASAAGAKKGRDRDAVENQLVSLAGRTVTMENLVHALDFARVDLPLEGSEILEEIFSEPRVGVGVVLENLDQLRERLQALQLLPPEELATRMQPIEEMSQRLSGVMERAFYSLALFPGTGDPADDEQWREAGSVIAGAVFGEAHEEVNVEGVLLLEALVHDREDRAGFAAGVDALYSNIVPRAGERGEYAKIPLERTFYRGKFFLRALVFFLLAFVMLALSWLAPRTRWLPKGVWLAALAAEGLLIAGITLRCVIQGRPPVTTLYETILFITACCVLVSLFIEYIGKERVALGAATVLGAAGMFLARKYEFTQVGSSGDTMPSLVAVLDTNFWLATHVTTVTLGYAAGLLAAAMGHVWIIGRMVGWRRNDNAFYASLLRMVYGVICFGLLFSVVGTILGGVWANYSWGRFWGWDTKENGALLICLWELMILHARMGGYIKQFGLALLSILTGIIVAFSWWHVNLLEVGLHSYGHTSGVKQALFTYYGIELAVVTLALLWYLFTTRRTAAPAP